MRGTATFSPCGRYRYSLTRMWSDAAAPPTIVWLMLNPSTADAQRDDPTIRRCIGFSRSWGYDALVVVNLFAYRATNPRDLPKRRASAIGRSTDDAILRLTEGRPVCCAWGAHGAQLDRATEVVARLLADGRELLCLGITRDGHPRHPLRLSAALHPIEFSASRRADSSGIKFIE